MYTFTPLEGIRVKLVPLEVEHTASLYQCSQFPEIWSHYPFKIQSMEDMSGHIQRALTARDQNEQFPFAVYDKEHQEYVGSTRYLRISAENRNLNIGSTWFTPKVWRTGVNTETKYLMLKYAFETLNTNRVEIITTTENIRSQAAIERLGAVREGVLRKKYHGLDYIIYSIIDSEWSAVRDRLEGFLSSVK